MGGCEVTHCFLFKLRLFLYVRSVLHNQFSNNTILTELERLFQRIQNKNAFKHKCAGTKLKKSLYICPVINKQKN